MQSVKQIISLKVISKVFVEKKFLAQTDKNFPIC